MIGVVVPTLNSKITSRVITSIDRYLRDKGYTTLIQNSDHDIDQELQNIRAIENFSSDNVTVAQGDTKKAVVVTDYVTPVNAMAQLYMTVYVQ